jgi:hypothetical protein
MADLIASWSGRSTAAGSTSAVTGSRRSARQAAQAASAPAGRDCGRAADGLALAWCP